MWRGRATPKEPAVRNPRTGIEPVRRKVQAIIGTASIEGEVARLTLPPDGTLAAVQNRQALD